MEHTGPHIESMLFTTQVEGFRWRVPRPVGQPFKHQKVERWSAKAQRILHDLTTVQYKCAHGRIMHLFCLTHSYVHGSISRT